MAAAMRQMAGRSDKERAGGLTQNFREYDPEWGDAFVSGPAGSVTAVKPRLSARREFGGQVH
jgi:hypothetical protein